MIRILESWIPLCIDFRGFLFRGAFSLSFFRWELFLEIFFWRIFSCYQTYQPCNEINKTKPFFRSPITFSIFKMVGSTLQPETFSQLYSSSSYGLRVLSKNKILKYFLPDHSTAIWIKWMWHAFLTKILFLNEIFYTFRRNLYWKNSIKFRFSLRWCHSS